MDRSTPYNKVPLSIYSFRNELNESVLEWGWLYFNNGWVSEPREIMPGLYESVIKEACYQAVTWRQGEDEVLDAFCSCGTERFRHCRHVAALMFYLEDREKKEGEARIRKVI